MAEVFAGVVVRVVAQRALQAVAMLEQEVAVVAEEHPVDHTEAAGRIAAALGAAGPAVAECQAVRMGYSGSYSPI